MQHQSIHDFWTGVYQHPSLYPGIVKVTWRVFKCILYILIVNNHVICLPLSMCDKTRSCICISILLLRVAPYHVKRYSLSFGNTVVQEFCFQNYCSKQIFLFLGSFYKDISNFYEPYILQLTKYFLLYFIFMCMYYKPI